MKEQFVTYEIALKLKELGFDEPCCALFRHERLFPILGFEIINSIKQSVIAAPLWQQAFNWIFKQLDFYYPFIRLEIYSDASGGWYAPPDDDSNEYWNTPFSSLEEAINQVLDLILKSK